MSRIDRKVGAAAVQRRRRARARIACVRAFSVLAAAPSLTAFVTFALVFSAWLWVERSIFCSLTETPMLFYTRLLATVWGSCTLHALLQQRTIISLQAPARTRRSLVCQWLLLFFRVCCHADPFPFSSLLLSEPSSLSSSSSSSSSSNATISHSFLHCRCL